jgi:hypothetical protein
LPIDPSIAQRLFSSNITYPTPLAAIGFRRGYTPAAVAGDIATSFERLPSE